MRLLTTVKPSATERSLKGLTETDINVKWAMYETHSSSPAFTGETVRSTFSTTGPSVDVGRLRQWKNAFGWQEWLTSAPQEKSARAVPIPAFSNTGLTVCRLRVTLSVFKDTLTKDVRKTTHSNGKKSIIRQRVEFPKGTCHDLCYQKSSEGMTVGAAHHPLRPHTTTHGQYSAFRSLLREIPAVQGLKVIL